MASPQLQTIIQMLRARPRDPNATPQQMRDGFEQMTSLFPAAADVKVEKVEAGGRPAEWVSVPGSDASAVLYWLHGGGYVVGSLNTHRDLVSRICRAAGCRALAIDYRLAPENPFPAAVDDAVAGYRWLLAQGIAPERVIIGGDSAGGGLTVATLIALRDAGERLPAAAVCISPWTDLEGTGDSVKTRAAADPMIQVDPLGGFARLYYGSADVRDPLVSPIYADLSGLPPMLVQVGDCEVLLDDSTRLAERAKAAGVEVTLEVWDEMIHVWHFFAAMLPEAQQAIDRVGGYVRERISARAGAQAAAS